MAARFKLLLATLLLNTATVFGNDQETKMATYDTIIVGLGAAGVTAASTLAKAGKKVLGLEAQGRIGGRVKTVPFGDGIVEEGAEWIHGTHPNRAYDLAIQNNVSIVEQSLDMEVFRSDGTVGDKVLVGELITFCLDVIDEPSKDPEPLGQHVTRRLMDYLKEKHPKLLNDKDFLDEFLELMNQLVNSNEASNDWNDLSSQTFYEDLEGYRYASWHRHGYKTFFELLLNTYNNGPGLPNLDIKLNKEVTLIKWPKNTTGNVEVTCKDGETYTANNVIVTVSLGVLKERYSTLFLPMISPDKIIAIDKISMGGIGKIILSFPHSWWSKSLSPVFFWFESDKRNLSDDGWTSKFNFISTPVGSDNTITLWSYGESYKLVETLPEKEVQDKCMALLRRFLGKKFTIPEPTGMIRSTWFSNPFTRGTYSYDNLAMVEYPNARHTLAEPLLDSLGSPKVLFAGEATDFTHFSTVHGASDSGYREAMRLLPSVKV